MILHFFPYEKFTKDYIEFIESNFNDKRHIFILTGNKNRKNGYGNNSNRVELTKNILDINSMNLKQIHKLIKKAEKIIVHSLFQNIFLLMYLNIINTYKKNCFVVNWGGDLYINAKILIKIYRFMRIYLTKNFYHCFLSKSDIKKIQNIVKIRNNYFFVNYIDNYKFETISKKDNEIINILIGNSATKTNNHIEVLDKLSKFKNEKICIFIPLSYGSSEYAQYIENYAKNIFDKKVNCITKFMEKEQYYKMLEKMDIAIFNYNNQQGLGNIFSLIQCKKKIYINKKSPIWNDFVIDKKYKMFDINSIDNSDFEEFKTFNEKIALENLNTFNFDRGINHTVDLWKNVFNYEIKK